MRRLGILFLLGALMDCSNLRAEPADAAMTQAATLRERGDFKGSAVVLDDALKSPGLAAAQRKELEFQLDVLKRIKLDYTLTREDLFNQLSGSVRDLTAAEFNQWLGQGRFDGKMIDGRMLFVDISVDNLYYQYPELAGRRVGGKDEVSRQRKRLEVCRAIRKAAQDQQTPYVLPHDFVCTMTVTAEEGAAPAGEMIRAWLPVPRQFPYQDRFNLISSSSPVKALAPENSPIRSAYFEQPASKNGSAEFAMTYSYRASGVHFDLDADKVRPADLQDPVLKKFTSEAPHVVFTPKIKELAGKIAGNEANPLREARAIYDWIGANIKFSYAREYSTMANLSDFCLTNGYGDCGEEGMLFITLCRCRGIPARWQSGWNTFPGHISNHDWSEIYLAPYGWVPVDVWASVYATRYCTSLTTAERSELRDFYFGGLDYYRMSANSDHTQELSPPKQGLRSDDIDFQRGELECGGTNIYFDKYHCALRVHESGSVKGSPF